MLHRTNFLVWLSYVALVVSLVWVSFALEAIMTKGVNLILFHVLFIIIAFIVFIYFLLLKIHTYDDRLELHSLFGKKELLYSEIKNLEFKTVTSRSGTGISIDLTLIVLTLKNGIILKICASYYTRSDDLIHDLNIKLLDVNGKMRLL
jgi:hypothetical protein